MKDVIKELETKLNAKAADLEVVKMNGWMLPIDKMDSSVLSGLKKCRHLALSTNNIDKISSLQGLVSLEVLSLGRNQIKRLENLDSVADTLRQLWISYNLIEKLNGIEKCKKLKVLYISNNKIEKWQEIERLRELPELEDLLLVGNPIERATKDAGLNWRVEVVKRLPSLKRLDGKPVLDEDREGDLSAPAEGAPVAQSPVANSGTPVPN